MSGHSHSKTIKDRKRKQNEKKSDDFLSISKAIRSGKKLSNSFFSDIKKKNFSRKRIEDLMKKREKGKNVSVEKETFLYIFSNLGLEEEVCLIFSVEIFFDEKKELKKFLAVFSEKFGLKAIPSLSFSKYFKKFYSFDFNQKERNLLLLKKKNYFEKFKVLEFDGNFFVESESDFFSLKKELNSDCSIRKIFYPVFFVSLPLEKKQIVRDALSYLKKNDKTKQVDVFMNVEEDFL